MKAIVMNNQKQVIHKFPLSIRLLHWTMAFLIFGLIALGFYMASLPLEDPNKMELYKWHRAFGVLVIILTIARLFIKRNKKDRLPELPKTLPKYEKILAKSVQYFIYLFLVSIVITGYVASSAVPEFPGIPPLNSIWFFFTELPLAPVEKNYDTTVFVIGIHKILAYVFCITLGLHILGALKHRFFDKPEHDVIKTMV